MQSNNIKKLEEQIKLKTLQSVNLLLEKNIEALETLSKIQSDDSSPIETRIEASKVLLAKIYGDKKGEGNLGDVQLPNLENITNFIQTIKENV